jgi:uncharacterized repeat protein (TIGR01451 family)
VDYNVGGNIQEPILSDPNGNSTPGLGSGALATTFLVDNRVDFTLVESGFIGATQVNPGQADAVTTFELTNTGNSTQDYNLGVVNLVGGTVNSNTDTIEMSNLRVFADTDGGGTWTPADQIFVDELLEDASILLFVVVDASISLANADVGNIEVTATTHDAGAAGLGALTTDDAGVLDSVSTVQVVFADDGAGSIGDGIELASDGYIVSSAALSITKSSTVISDPFNLGVNPKAIPGATVEFNITVQNNGAVDADQVRIEDVLNGNLALALGEYGGAGLDARIDLGSGTTVTTCSLDPADGDNDGCGTAGATITIDPGLTVGTQATDNPAVISFRVTIN